jgi:hypothetical protein
MPIELAKDNEISDETSNSNRYAKVLALARQAGGFDVEIAKRKDFNLQAFFDLIVENCAHAAELQARSYSDGNAGSGCHAAASAVRCFGTTVGLPVHPTEHTV